MTEPLDTRELRSALGLFPTGVAVITTVDPDGNPRGFTANSFTSVSLDPPLLLVCIAKTAASRPVFQSAAAFAVNFLADNQKDISGLFASQRPDKFDAAAWHPGTGGLPLIDDSLAWFECARRQAVDAGDHVILIGEVTDFAYAKGTPLGYLSGGYFNPRPEITCAASPANQGRVIVGTILQRDRSILLMDDAATGKIILPAVGRHHEAANMTALSTMLANTGIDAMIDFLYAVFEDPATGVQSIYYRGHTGSDAPPGSAFYPLDNIPLERLESVAVKMMVERYARESEHGNFAVYSGDDLSGETRPSGPGRP